MKFCEKCGKEMMNEATICPNCGAPAGYATAPNEPSGLHIAAKVFMIIGTVLMGFTILPLAWALPMTITYCRKLKRGEKISTGFKVCSLLFVSLLGGIFMLCAKD